MIEQVSASTSVEDEYGLSVYRDNRLVTMRLNRPPTRNAITEADIDGMIAELQRIDDAPSDRAVVVTGSVASRGFCAGIDLSVPLTRSMPTFMRRVGALIALLHNLSVPTIAAVRGPAVGVGFSLALACDFIIADEASYFLMPFHQRGLTLDGGATWLLPRRVGVGRAKEIAFMCERVDARRARELGIANVVTDSTTFDDTVRDWSTRLVAGPPQAQRLSKELLNTAATTSLQAALVSESYAQSVASSSAEAKEGIKAFFTKRSPAFPDG